MSYISGFQTDGSYIDLGSDVIAQLSKLIFSSDAKETPISCNAIFSKIRITEESGTVIGIKINSESISKCVNDFLNCLMSQDCSFSGSDATFLSATMTCEDFFGKYWCGGECTCPSSLPDCNPSGVCTLYPIMY